MATVLEYPVSVSMAEEEKQRALLVSVIDRPWRGVYTTFVPSGPSRRGAKRATLFD